LSRFYKHPHDDRSFLERLTDILSPGPDNKPELYQFLKQAHDRKIIDAEGLSMIEGVIQLNELTAGDIMIPQAKIDMLSSEYSVDEVISFAISKSHSRFPVYEGTFDNIIGMLLAKDLLPAYAQLTQQIQLHKTIKDQKEPNKEAAHVQHLQNMQTLQNLYRDFDWHAHLRPVLFIPESQPLNHLLRDFRLKKNHLALVVDEFSQIVGLITIEDVIEQITGEIEDEYDFDEGEAHIISTHRGKNKEWRINAVTDLDDFNAYFKTEFMHPHAETIGGFIIQAFGRMPHKNEHIVIEGWRFEILKSDARQIHILTLRQALPGLD
jgi:magnesium and cobalt transporter